MSIFGKSRGKPVTRLQFEKIVKQFIIFTKKELRITFDIPIYFVDDANFSSKISAFGKTSNTNIIHVSIINRHPMDILRTLAHEIVHYKQHITKGISRNHNSSNAGSPIEDQANAKAGEILRKFGALHPEYFELTSIK